MSKNTTATTAESTTEVAAKVKKPSRYAEHYARLRELQAERKAKRDEMLQKIAAAQQEYRDYMEKYNAARAESEEQFKAAAKPKADKTEATEATAEEAAA